MERQSRVETTEDITPRVCSGCGYLIHGPHIVIDRQGTRTYRHEECSGTEGISKRLQEIDSILGERTSTSVNSRRPRCAVE